jgi:deoxyribodipyrimidine photo-lyase
VHRTALMWFRRDLRLADNAALLDAVARAETVACVYVSPDGRDPHAPGSAFLSRSQASLAALSSSLAEQGCQLILLVGPASEAIPQATSECGATVVTCSRDWTPAGLAEERAVAEALSAAGIELRCSEGQLLAVPGSVCTNSGAPFRVFTPFHRQWLRSVAPSAPEPAPPGLRASRPTPSGERVRPGRAAAKGTSVLPEPGERGAHTRLDEFATAGLAGYEKTHDLPAVDGTSGLSAPLACGELSPRQVAWAARQAVGEEVAAQFVRQLAWREFSYNVLAADPDSLDEPLRREFSAMPWRDDPESLVAWTAGRTGWPIVDAGMRQLAETGWMHNRVRMVAASVLTKDLLVPWQRGAAAFERLLADYDPAANTFNWQWVAGSGADAAPYFRIFNPTLQGTRFDPEGDYVRRWVPELVELPVRYVHRPWDAPATVLKDAGVRLGENYPHQLIDHAEGRRRALAAYSAVKANRT